MGFGLRVGKVTGDDVCSTFTFALTALAAFLQKWIKKKSYILSRLVMLFSPA